MAVLIGEKERFAVEIIIDLPANSPGFGYACFWLGGKPVGDIERITILNSLRSNMATFIKNRNHRVCDAVFALTGAEVLTAIEASYWKGDAEFMPGTDANPYYFILCPTGTESFDGYKVFVTENTVGGQKVLFETPEGVAEFLFDNGTVERVLQEWINWTAPLADRGQSIAFQNQHGTPHRYDD